MSDRESMAKEVCEAIGVTFSSVQYERMFFRIGTSTMGVPIRQMEAIHAILCRAKTAERQVGELLEAASSIKTINEQPTELQRLARTIGAIKHIEQVADRIAAERGGKCL